MPNYEITTDYSTNATWTLEDPDRSSIKNAVVGTLGQQGSNMGHQVNIQKNALIQLMDELESLRDTIRSLSSQGFEAMKIDGVRIRPPESVDIQDLLGGRRISSLELADIDRLVGLASWINANFSPWIGNSSPLLDFKDVKVTFSKEGSSTDSWIALKDIYPLPVVPPGEVPRTADGSVQLNRPFFFENDNAVYMMIGSSSGVPEQVKIKSIEKMFFLDTVRETFGSSSNYFAQLAKARTDALIAKLPESAKSTVPFGAVAFRFVDSLDLTYSSIASLPIVDTSVVIQTAGSSFGPIQAPKGSLIKSPVSAGANEFKYYYVYVANPSKPADIGEAMVDTSTKYILSLSDEEKQTVTSQLGESVVTLTQKSSQQATYLNELMQLMALFFDAASNAVKSITDNDRQVASGI